MVSLVNHLYLLSLGPRPSLGHQDLSEVVCEARQQETVAPFLANHVTLSIVI